MNPIIVDTCDIAQCSQHVLRMRTTGKPSGYIASLLSGEQRMRGGKESGREGGIFHLATLWGCCWNSTWRCSGDHVVPWMEPGSLAGKTFAQSIEPPPDSLPHSLMLTRDFYCQLSWTCGPCKLYVKS